MQCTQSSRTSVHVRFLYYESVRRHACWPTSSVKKARVTAKRRYLSWYCVRGVSLCASSLAGAFEHAACMFSARWRLRYVQSTRCGWVGAGKGGSGAWLVACGMRQIIPTRGWCPLLHIRIVWDHGVGISVGCGQGCGSGSTERPTGLARVDKTRVPSSHRPSPSYV